MTNRSGSSYDATTRDCSGLDSGWWRFANEDETGEVGSPNTGSGVNDCVVVGGRAVGGRRTLKRLVLYSKAF